MRRETRQRVRGSRGPAERNSVLRSCRWSPVRKDAVLDGMLEEEKIDEEAADRWREEEGLPPLSKKSRRRSTKSCGGNRKWLEIHKKRQEPVDHEQFFRELGDPDTGGFDCVARWIGKGVISDDAPIDVEL